MKTKKRKKYSLGTGKNGVVRHYIESPSETLVENDIAMARAKQKAANNGLANGLDIFGNMALQYGMNMAGGTKGVGKGIGQGFSNIFGGGGDTAAFGGPVGGIDVEVEGEEVGETPSGQLIDFKGPSHENGGIDVNLPEGTEIFSKRITVKGKTMAERKMAREKKVMTLEKLLEKSGDDAVLKKTIARTKNNNKLEEGKDQKLQDMVGMMKQMASFAYGGNLGKKMYMDGTGPGGIKYGDPDPNNPENPYGYMNDQDFLAKAQNFLALNSGDSTETGSEESLLPGENKVKMPNLTGGDLIGLAGTAFSAFEPMKNTQANRAGDTPNINAFKDFGNDALDRVEEAKGYVAGQRDKALRDLEIGRTRRSKLNRNSARGVNTQRALDLASDVNINDAQSDIYDNFAKQMMQLVSQEAGLENQQDQAVMTGEQQRDLADRQDRDNYFTQMAQDIATKGEGIQTIGKMLNQNKANTVAEQAVNDSSINFKYDSNGTLTDKAGNVVMTQAEIAKAAKAIGITPEEYINMLNKQ